MFPNSTNVDFPEADLSLHILIATAFVLDSFSVKADDSSYFTKDGHGGKSLIVQFRELSGEIVLI